ncbi:MAG: hypothetical protein HY360_01855 [Verrucomicrobia bacterium]|nr:hypothetical protein [Verrucomicrobiota bacterium]
MSNTLQPTPRDIARLHQSHAALSIHRAMEVRREEYLDYMTFRANQRPLFTEIFGPLIGLKEEWAAQGASPSELDFSAFRYRRPMLDHIPVHTGWLGGDQEEILEETEEHIIARDRMGRRVKLCKQSATVPLPMDHPVADMDDWLRVKSHYQFSEARFGADWENQARAIARKGQVVCVSIPGGFDEPRQLMGEEELCVAYYAQPGLIHDILGTIAETAFRVLDRVTERVPVDQLNVHDDMAGKSGPLAGPRQIGEFIKPYYRRIWDLLQSRGARLFYQDSDGDMSGVIPALLDCGLNAIGPMEPVGGNDIVRLREIYGRRLAFMGGLDKHVLRRSKGDIVTELERKIPPMVCTGGCLLGLDHRIPNGTPLDNYRFYIKKAWEILDLSAARQTGHESVQPVAS